MKRISLISAMLLGLSACGGGGGGGNGSTTAPPSTPTPPTPAPSPDAVTPILSENGLLVFGQLSAQVGEAVGFALRSDDGTAVRSINWSTTNTTVNILAPHTQAIGFDVSDVGQIPLTANVTLANNQQHTLNFTLDVVAPSAPDVDIRLDHAATEGGRVSLRVDSSETSAISNVVWQQISGPTPTNIRFGSDSNDGPQQSLFFDAPRVSRDEVIVYEAEVTFEDGSTGSDLSFLMVKDSNINDEGFFPSAANNIVTADMMPYNADSPYARALQECVYNNVIEQTCSFGRLPLIGQVTANPTIDDILDRTLVSHQWMGDRFKAFLETSATSEDMLQLLGATTAIVISYDVRPSFYWVATGAIYLDGNNFWQTPEERDTLNTAPDFRSNFGNDLQFGIFWRYVRDNVYYFPQRGLTAASRQSRTSAQTEAALAWLMYHELAHANDFFDYTKWASLSDADNPLSNFRSNAPRSDEMTALYPLQSQELDGLAQVAFGGTDATAVQRAYTADDAASFFVTDQAPAFYSYFTEREDYATLFERFMMLHRLGVSADVGVIADGTDIVTWGQRDRISDPLLDARTAFTVRNILPSINLNTAQAALPAPEQLTPGRSWFDFASFEQPPTPLKSTVEQAQPIGIPLSEHHRWHPNHLKLTN